MNAFFLSSMQDIQRMLLDLEGSGGEISINQSSFDSSRMPYTIHLDDQNERESKRG